MGMCDGHPVGSNRFASKTHEFDMRHVSGTHEGLGVCFFCEEREHDVCVEHTSRNHKNMWAMLAQKMHEKSSWLRKTDPPPGPGSPPHLTQDPCLAARHPPAPRPPPPTPYDTPPGKKNKPASPETHARRPRSKWPDHEPVKKDRKSSRNFARCTLPPPLS